MSQKTIIHYDCPFDDFSTYNASESIVGEALQDVKNHLRSWHKRNDLDDKIIVTEVTN